MVVTDEERAKLDVKIEVTLKNAEGAVIKKEKRTIDELTGNRRQTQNSRNPNDFCSQLCPETWLVQDGVCDCKGDAEWMKNAMKESVEFKAMETMTDARGNEVKVKQEKKKLSRREQKAAAKEKKMRKARGEVVSDSEDDDF